MTRRLTLLATKWTNNMRAQHAGTLLIDIIKTIVRSRRNVLCKITRKITHPLLNAFYKMTRELPFEALWVGYD